MPWKFDDFRTIEADSDFAAPLACAMAEQARAIVGAFDIEDLDEFTAEEKITRLVAARDASTRIRNLITATPISKELGIVGIWTVRVSTEYFEQACDEWFPRLANVLRSGELLNQAKDRHEEFRGLRSSEFDEAVADEDVADREISLTCQGLLWAVEGACRTIEANHQPGK